MRMGEASDYLAVCFSHWFKFQYFAFNVFIGRAREGGGGEFTPQFFFNLPNESCSLENGVEIGFFEGEMIVLLVSNFYVIRFRQSR